MSNKHNNSGFVGGDDRLKKSDGADVRADRGSADANRTQYDGTAFSADERRQLYRREGMQEILPTPPEIPGYHLCWLSTNSKVDPIHSRIRFGYTPVKAHELPGFEKFSMKGGDFDGVVSCNEMVLFKLPMDIYQEMMTVYQHEMPLEQEQSIRQQIEGKNKDDVGRKAVVYDEDDEGMRSMGRNRKAPIFS